MNWHNQRKSVSYNSMQLDCQAQSQHAHWLVYTNTQSRLDELIGCNSNTISCPAWSLIFFGKRPRAQTSTHTHTHRTLALHEDTHMIFWHPSKAIFHLWSSEEIDLAAGSYGSRHCFQSNQTPTPRCFKSNLCPQNVFFLGILTNFLMHQLVVVFFLHERNSCLTCCFWCT